MQFTGFRPEGLDLLIENRIQNNKAFYEAHKPQFRELIVEPFHALICEMAPTMLKIDPGFVIDPAKMLSRFRRDTRYTKDKTLYRDHMWITFGRMKGAFSSRPCYYFEISPQGLSYGCGYYQAPPSEMQIAREMMLREDKLFLDAYHAVEKSRKFVQYGESYKRPKYPDAPEKYQHWLNKKNIGVSYDSAAFDKLFDGSFVKPMLKDLKAIAPLYHFMCAVKERAGAAELEQMR